MILDDSYYFLKVMLIIVASNVTLYTIIDLEMDFDAELRIFELLHSFSSFFFPFVLQQVLRQLRTVAEPEVLYNLCWKDVERW